MEATGGGVSFGGEANGLRGMGTPLGEDTKTTELHP